MVWSKYLLFNKKKNLKTCDLLDQPEKKIYVFQNYDMILNFKVLRINQMALWFCNTKPLMWYFNTKGYLEQSSCRLSGPKLFIQ